LAIPLIYSPSRAPRSSCAVAADGETTWYEGFLLIGVYLLFALAYFFLDET
jgi:hypothetical protein